MNRLLQSPLSLLAWLFLPALLLLLTACSDPEPEEGGEGETAMEHAEKHADPEYTCPMHTDVREDEPGQCPICGMDLVPVEEAEEEGSDTAEGPAVEMGGRLTQALGVRTEEARREDLRPRVRAPVRLTIPPDQEHRLHARVRGWVRELHVAGEGEPVAAGDPLLTLYSPELVNAQREYLRARGTDGEAAATERLRALGVSRDVRRQIARAGEALTAVPITAPADGVVTELPVRAGEAVGADRLLATVADLDPLWALAEVFPRDVPVLREGLPAEVVPHQRPWEEREGTVQRILPEADPDSRTVAVRIPLANGDGTLTPGLFGRATIRGPAREGVVTVSRQAVIRTGDEARVIIAHGDGGFSPRPVETGLTADGRTAILEGLEPGERVVTSGHFLLDSEADTGAGGGRMEGADGEDDQSGHGGMH
ncbi:MAG: efflux RND transporter periplasmic adaptor subunit [Pseudomonadota bacterium]